MKKIPLDLILYFISKLIPGCSGLLFIYFGHNLLGAKRIGEYLLNWSMIIMIVTFFTTWIKQAILRYKYQFNTNEMYSAILVSSIISGCVIGAGVVFYSIYFNKTIDSIIIVLLLTLILYFQTILITINQSGFKAKKIALVEVVRSCIYSIAPVIVYYYEKKVEIENELLVVVGFSYILSCLFFIQKRAFKFVFVFSVLKKMFGYGWPMSLWLTVTFSLTYFDRYMIEHRAGAELLGDFSSLSEIYMRVYGLVFAPVLLYFHPIIVKKFHEKGMLAVHKIIKKALLMELFVFFMMVVIEVFFGRYFVNYLFPKISLEVKNISLLILAQGFMWQWVLLIHKKLELFQRTKTMLFLILICAVGHMYIINRYYYGENLYWIPLSSFLFSSLYGLCVFVIQLFIGRGGDRENY